MTSLRQDLKQRYESVRQRIDEADAIRTTHSKTALMAVSKGQATEKIRTLYDLGHRYFGENYAQELFAKSRELDLADLNWSYIGHLQSKKIRKLIECNAEIHCLDSLSHAGLIAKIAGELAKTPYPVWISVNADGEKGKSGVPIEAARSFYEQLKLNFSDALHVCGLMAVPSASHASWIKGTPIPETYRKLAELAPDIGDGHLSLGMSSDLELAIAAGSTLVRIGTDLFGLRPPKGQV